MAVVLGIGAKETEHGQPSRGAGRALHPARSATLFVHDSSDFRPLLVLIVTDVCVLRGLVTCVIAFVRCRGEWRGRHHSSPKIPSDSRRCSDGNSVDVFFRFTRGRGGWRGPPPSLVF